MAFLKYQDRNWLLTQYSTKMRSIENIAEECLVHPITIKNWLKISNIQIRYTKPNRKNSGRRIRYKKKRVQLNILIDEDDLQKIDEIAEKFTDNNRTLLITQTLKRLIATYEQQT